MGLLNNTAPPLSTHQVNFAEPKVLFPQTESPNPRAYHDEQSNIIGKQPPDWDPLLEGHFVDDAGVTDLPPRQRGRSSYESYTHKQSFYNNTRPTRQLYKRDEEYPLSDNEESQDREYRANLTQPAPPHMHSYRNPLVKTHIPKSEHTSDTDSVSDVDDY